MLNRPAPVDPFDQFRMKREIEKLEERIKASRKLKKHVEPKPVFDPDRSWIY